MEHSSSHLPNPNIITDQPWPIAIKYGAIAAGYIIFVMMVQFFMGMTSLEYLTGNITDPNLSSSFFGFLMGVFNIAMYIYFYYLAIKEYREQLGGFINFWNGYKVAFYSVIIKAGLLFMWQLLYYSFIDAGYGEVMLEVVAISMDQSATSANDATMDFLMGMYERMSKPLPMALMYAIGTLIGGSILCLIAAASGQRHP